MKRIAFGSIAVIAVLAGATVLDRNEVQPARPAHLAPMRATPESVIAPEPQTPSVIATRPRAELLSPRGAPVDLGGLTVRAFIDRWSRAARTGDADAAYRVYSAEALCARAAENEQMLRAQSAAPGDGMRDRIETANETLRPLCSGVSPAEVDERLVFLTQAARSGNADAQLDFYAEGPLGKLSELRTDDRDLNVDTWKSQAIAFLKQAAMQNNRDALEALAVAYFNGVVVPQDFEASLTYEIALARANHKDPDLALLVTQLVDRLPEPVVARARNAGEALYRQCCSDRNS